MTLLQIYPYTDAIYRAFDKVCETVRKRELQFHPHLTTTELNIIGQSLDRILKIATVLQRITAIYSCSDIICHLMGNLLNDVCDNCFSFGDRCNRLKANSYIFTVYISDLLGSVPTSIGASQLFSVRFYRSYSKADLGSVIHKWGDWSAFEQIFHLYSHVLAPT